MIIFPYTVSPNVAFYTFFNTYFMYLVALDLVVTRGIFSSPTRDGTQAPCVESLES